MSIRSKSGTTTCLKPYQALIKHSALPTYVRYMLRINMLNVLMLSVVMLSVVILSVIMLSVVASNIKVIKGTQRTVVCIEKICMRVVKQQLHFSPYTLIVNYHSGKSSI